MAWGLVAPLIAVFPGQPLYGVHPIEAEAAGIAAVLRRRRLTPASRISFKAPRVTETGV